MFEIPSPYRRPSLTNGSGWKPGTPCSHGSRPEYEVSMWPLNIRVLPRPVPGHVPRTFARPSSTWCHWVCRPILPKLSSIRRPIASSSPVKLGVAIIRLACSTRRSRSMLIAPAPAPAKPAPPLFVSLRQAYGSSNLRQDALGEELQLPEPVLAPQLEHHVSAAGLLVLPDCGNAVLGRAGDRLALVEDLVGHGRLRGEAPTGLHRLGDRDDLVLGQPRALEQRVGGALDVLHLVGEVHTGDLARAVAAALAVVVHRGNNRTPEVERVRVAPGGLHLLPDVPHERRRSDRGRQQPVGDLRRRLQHQRAGAGEVQGDVPARSLRLVP